MQNFRGVSLYQPAGIQNMSHIIAMFDSGAGVEVMTTEGHMTARFYLPRTYINNTRGLLGFYDGDKRNDFRPPLGNTYSTINYDQSNLRDLHEFGMKWRVKEGADVPGEFERTQIAICETICELICDQRLISKRI